MIFVYLLSYLFMVPQSHNHFSFEETHRLLDVFKREQYEPLTQSSSVGDYYTVYRVVQNQSLEANTLGPGC